MTEQAIRTEIKRRYPTAFQYIFHGIDNDYDKIEAEMLAMRDEDPALWDAADDLESALMCPPSVLDPDVTPEDEYDAAGCFGCKYCWDLIQQARK